MKDTLNYIMATSAIIITFAVVYLVVVTATTRPVPPPIQNIQYPLNMEVFSNISSSALDDSIVDRDELDKLIIVAHKINFNPETKKFVYIYRLTFNGKKNCFLVWDALDQVIYEKQTTTPHLIELIPRKTQEFKLESPLPPALYEGYALLYIKGAADVWDMHRLSVQPILLPKK